MSKVKFFLLALVALFFAATVSADVVWSSAFDFDGSEITEPVLLKPTDSIGFTTTVAGGSEKEISIRAINDKDPSINKLVHYEYVGDSDAEGTVVWNYTSLDIPKNETYTLKEMIDSTSTGIELSRKIAILPEPAALLILGLVGAMFLRRRAKSLLVVLAFLSLGALGAKATTISVGKCFQMWPFERKVIINYTVSDLSETEYINFYYTTDNGESSYDLRDNGLLTGDVGPISANGNYRVVWTPDTETMASVKGKMKIGVDVFEPDPPGPSNYMIVDLSGGASASSYPVTYTDDIPEGGWNVDEYKTSKMVFRLISPGEFTMGSPNGELGHKSDEPEHKVTLTKGYYIGIFEVTDYQYGMIDGTGSYNPSYPGRPRKGITYDAARGANAGAGWPGSSAVDSDSFIGKLRSKSGLAFDLPTEAQWEYACRATTTTALNSGKNLSNKYDDCPEMAEVGTYDGNAMDPAKVGSYLPNIWGIYDMHGNVAERCLDWYGALSQADATDPVGPSSGANRVLRSGSYLRDAEFCRSACRCINSDDSQDVGLRLVLVVE
ncbi:formylglycine-generating enzyme family protein [bacterium]|nr:formylglycine-generating enzyme family protein [bacterium]